MHRLRDHALSVRKELKTWVAVISLTLLASAAWADPVFGELMKQGCAMRGPCGRVQHRALRN